MKSWLLTLACFICSSNAHARGIDAAGLRRTSMRHLTYNTMSGFRAAMLALIGLTTHAWGAGAPIVNLDSPERVPGSFYVTLKPDVDLSEFKDAATNARATESTMRSQEAELVRQLGLQWTRQMKSARVSGGDVVGTHKAIIIEGASDDEIRKIVAQDPRVERVAATILAHLTGTQSSAPWGLSRLSNGPLPPLGEFGFPNSYTYDNTAPGVRIYILDTGVRTTHSDFGGRAGTVVLDCVAGLATMSSCGLSIPNTNPNKQDCDGHGTHVASNAAGNTYGVAKGANIAAFIIGNSSNFGQACGAPLTTAPIIAAFHWIVQHERFNWNGPQVINLSFTETVVDTELETAIQEAISAGLTVVNSVPNGPGVYVPGFAGEWGVDPCNGSTAVSPSRMPTIIAVGGSAYVLSPLFNLGTLYHLDMVANPATASRQYDVGSCIALFAGAVGIAGAANTADNDINSMDGTSFASPIVAGAAAIYLQTHAHASPAEVKNALINASLTGQIVECYQQTPSGPYTIHYLGDSFCPRTAPNRLAHLPLPVGSDIAVGGTTGGAWVPVTRIISAILSIFNPKIKNN
jgi:subtilisin family serine protease